MDETEKVLLPVEEKRRRGFAAMSPEKQRLIAQRGGQMAHRKGVAHVWNVDEARAAGKKGGKKVSTDKAHMGAIGKLGGFSTGRAKSLAAARAEMES